MEKLFEFVSNIFRSNPDAGYIGSIDFNLTFLQWFGVPLFGVKRKTKAYKRAFLVYGFLILTFLRLPYTAFEFYDILFYLENLVDLTQNLCLSMIHLGGTIKTIMVVSRLEEIRKIIEQFENMTRRYAKSKKQKDALYSIEFESKMSMIVYFGMVLITTLLGMGIALKNPTILENIFPYRAKMPDFMPLNVKVFYMPMAVLIIAVQVAGIDFLNVTFMNLLRCQLQILDTSFDQLNVSVVSEVTVDTVTHLNDIVKHHTHILEIREQIEDIFRYPMLVQFVSSLLIYAFTGFQALVRSDTSGLIMIYFYVSCIMGQLFIYCWFGNEVSEQNKTLAIRGYDTTWYIFDLKFRKSLLIFLLNAQKPFYFTAGGFMDLSLLTYSKILSKSYTCIAVLRQQYFEK